MPTPLQSLCAASSAILSTNKAMLDLLVINSKEIAAIRETLKKRDAKFEALYGYERKEANSTSQLVPVVAQMKESIDETLLALAEIQQILSAGS